MEKKQPSIYYYPVVFLSGEKKIYDALCFSFNAVSVVMIQYRPKFACRLKPEAST